MAHLYRYGEIPERSKGTDCKSVASASKVRILLPPPKSFHSSGCERQEFLSVKLKSGSSSVGRAIAFQAIGREFEPRLPLNL